MKRRPPKTRNRKLKRQIIRAKQHQRPERIGYPFDDWMQRYHDFICDYLVAHLSGYRELAAWPVAYTALHEMLGAVWNQPRPQDPEADEQVIWATFRPTFFVESQCLSMLHRISLLPANFTAHAFEDHYSGFILFLAEQGVTSQENAERIAAELHQALWGEAVGAA